MILTVTLNASIDKAYHLDSEPVLGTVMRVGKVVNTAGGKGLNVARAINNCGGQALATGMIGGHNGRMLTDLLKRDKVKYDFCNVNNETRCCINVLDNNYNSTEFLEPGFTVGSKDIQNFLKKYKKLLKDCDSVTLSGSLPKGVNKDFYATLIEIAKQKGVKTFLDSSGEMLKLGLNSRPFFAKPNVDEIKQLFDIEIRCIEDGKLAACKLKKLGVEHACVSMGKLGAVLAHGNYVYWGSSPGDSSVNTVGCGDTFVAAYATGISSGKDVQDCLAMALAASKANSMSMETGHFDRDAYHKILDQTHIKIEAIHKEAKC